MSLSIGDIRLSVTVAFDSNQTKRQEGYSMSDSEWASKTAKNFQRMLAEKSQKAQVFLEEQKIRQSDIGNLWIKLRGAFTKKVNDFNHEMGEETLTIGLSDKPDKFSIRRNKPETARVEVNCDRDTQEIKIVFSKADILDIGVGIDEQSGKPILVVGKVAKEVEEIAESSIEKLLVLTCND
jgi:hypothetical protein